MSVRRNTTNRLILYRVCGICGRSFQTTAASPWIRQTPRDGKRQATTYFCSSACYKASYKHIGWYDGKAQERRKEREAKRDTQEKNRKFYQAHAEEERARARARYWANRESALMDQQYQREKRKLIIGER